MNSRSRTAWSCMAFFWVTSFGVVEGSPHIAKVVIDDGQIPTVIRDESGLARVSGDDLLNGTFDAGLIDWTVEQFGGSSSPGTVMVINGQAVLAEGDSFLTTLNQCFAVPPGVEALTVDVFADGTFDLTDNFIPDAFEISLLDNAAEPVIAPWDVLATSSYNLQEDGAINQGSDTSQLAQTVIFDLRGVAAGTPINLFFDLIGGDTDTGSSVAVDNVRLLSSFPGTELVWDNGPADGISGVISTVNNHMDTRAADDCWLKEGLFYDIESIRVRMAVTTGFEPDTELAIYADCDGRPDDSNVLAVLPQTSFEDLGAASGPLEGRTIWEITYAYETFKTGEEIVWLSPVQLGDGIGFWVTANAGKVQGRQSQARSAGLGFPSWTDVQDDVCCGICTDLFMQVDGRCCWRIIDQSNYALDGLTAPILSQNAPWVRTLDDMQVAEPCKQLGEVSICRVEAYFATNCDLSTVRLDIYENNCDAPADPLDAALATFEWTSLEDTGEFIDGLPLYKFIFRCPPGQIPTGQNYWLSIYSEQGFAAGKRSVWAWNEPDACGRRLNEAMYRNPAIGFDPATPQSDAFLAGTPREQAFSVWVCEPKVGN